MRHPPPPVMIDLSQASGDRVRHRTADEVNAAIDRGIERNVRLYRNQDDGTIRERIRELDEEWDMERVLETNASALALAGVVLAVTHSRKWLALSAAVTGFLLLHATQGWCPPVPALRRMGVRTRKEIDREKYALLGCLRK
jgi:hypothetical protein